LLFVSTGLFPLLFLCIHVLPDYGWCGQPKHVVVWNTPNIQHLYCCVRRIIKAIICLINKQRDDITEMTKCL
jgi:hypothetical protein